MYNFFENKKIIEYPVIDMEATGNHIKKLRKKANFSVKELKEILGFEAVQTIYQWEKGKSLPSLENLFLLSNLFKKEINEIVLIKNKQQV